MYPAILGSPVLVWPTNSNRSEQRGFQLGDQLELGHTTHLSIRDKSITGRSLEACGCNVHSIMFLSGKFLTPKPCKSPKSRCNAAYVQIISILKVDTYVLQVFKYVYIHSVCALAKRRAHTARARGWQKETIPSIPSPVGLSHARINAN
jgi:hypothetical protein